MSRLPWSTRTITTSGPASLYEQIAPDREDANPRTKVVARAARARVVSQQVEALGDELDHAISCFDVSCFLKNVERDVLEVGFRLGGKAIRHQRVPVGFSAAATR
jgi:hypothetical protein